MTDRQSSPTNPNTGTWLALVGLILIAMFLLGLVALVLPKIVYLFIVLAGFFLLGALQYLILALWFSRRPTENCDQNKAD